MHIKEIFWIICLAIATGCSSPDFSAGHEFPRKPTIRQSANGKWESILDDEDLPPDTEPHGGIPDGKIKWVCTAKLADKGKWDRYDRAKRATDCGMCAPEEPKTYTDVAIVRGRDEAEAIETWWMHFRIEERARATMGQISPMTVVDGPRCVPLRR